MALLAARPLLPQPGRQAPTPLPTTSIRRSRLTVRAACILLGCALLGPVRPAAAQGDVRLSGPALIDYYQITSPDEAVEGLSGFTYRRCRSTTDVKLSDAFSARLRLDAQASSFGDQGPQPFVKELYLAWNVGGHPVRIRVTPPPVTPVAGCVYGQLGFYPTARVTVAVASAAAGPITDAWHVGSEAFVDPEVGPGRIGTANTTFGRPAVAFHLDEGVPRTPNVLVAKDHDVDQADVLGRFTGRLDV